MIVDDNQDAAALLSDLLASLGHETAVAFVGPAITRAYRRSG